MRYQGLTSGEATKHIYDELYGFIPLNQVEAEIVDTPTFQRLRRVKQLAQAWYVYPGAVHTRFSHSLGAFMVASVIGEKLVREGVLKSDEAEVLRVAALLHDVGHTPYSHALEEYFSRRYGVSHEEVGKWVIEEDPYITEVLRKHGIDPKEVSALIQGLHRNIALNELLSSDVDVDRLDYLPRDALHTGVAYGLIDKDRIIQTLTVDPYGYLAVPPKSVQAIESFYVARLHMYRAVYYHKTITAYQLMMSKIYEVMCEDPEVSTYIQPFTDPKGLREAIRSGNLYVWDDFLVGGAMSQVVSKGLGSKELRKLVTAYLNRQGYRVAFEEVRFGSWEDNEEFNALVKELEDVVARKVGECIDVLVFHSFIPIFSEEEVVRVVVGKESSVPIREYGASIVRGLPEVMYVVRVYALPSLLSEVSSLLRTSLTIK